MLLQSRSLVGLSCRRVPSTACWIPSARAKQPASGKRAASIVARAESSNFAGGLLEGEDFYTILNLPPTADLKDIKRSYHALMRQFHPDRWGVSGIDTSEICTLLNEIYDTLSDEDRRATYDALAGFSVSALNPFLDTRFARDQVFVDEIACIGCGKCVRVCPMTFEIEASKYGRARVISQTSATPDEIQIAIESCPVDCIHWVSLPQLSLLETALANMARVEVYIMMRFGRSGGNVFEMAYKAWERRQAAIAARAEAAQQKQQQRVNWDFWRSTTLQYEEDAEERAASQDPEQRKIANLAAAAARAARLWRLMNAGNTGPVKSLAESSTASMDG